MMKFLMICFLLRVPLLIQMFSDCRRTKRILILDGKNVTDVNKYPWMVQLFRNGGFSCGGSLINSKYILTAAHCVTNTDTDSITIRLMELDLTGDNRNTAIARKVNRIVIHNYNENNFNDDIALLRLDHKVKLGQKPGYPSPISLPPKGESFSDMNGTVIGWGLTTVDGKVANVLQEIEVLIISNDKCKKMRYTNITPNKICAGFPGGKRGPCNVMVIGDSGSPLMVMTNSQYYVVGIVSYGRECGDNPIVYTRVNWYLKWISKNTKDV